MKNLYYTILYFSNKNCDIPYTSVDFTTVRVNALGQMKVYLISYIYIFFSFSFTKNHLNLILMPNSTKLRVQSWKSGGGGGITSRGLIPCTRKSEKVDMTS